MIEITANDTLRLVVTVKENGTPVDLSAASSVKAVLTNKKGNVPSAGAVAQANSGQADWASGVVEVVMTPAQTAEITKTSYSLAIETVVAGNVTTYWYSSITGRTDPIANV